MGLRVVQAVTFGRLGNSLPFGPPVIWVTTKGRKSGVWRQNPLVGVPEDDTIDSAWVVTGTNAGQARTPAWVYNVRATPEAFVEADGLGWRVRVEEATGEDAELLFAHLEQALSWFTSYRERLDREVPVFRVIRVAEIPRAEIPAAGS